MSGSFVLDTNIAIALFDHEMSVKERLNDADEVVVPAIVIGELYHGAYRSRRPDENATRVDGFARSHTIVSVDSEIAQFYGQIKSQLRAAGTPIPDNDIWIAAVTLRLDAMLATRDDHFLSIRALKIER